MNDYFKRSLILQIPNGLIVAILAVSFLILRIDWTAIWQNLPIIIVATVWVLINLASLFYAVAGIFKKD
jgi:hypothetical protein